MDETRGHYANEITQPEKEKYCMVSLTSGILKKIKLIETDLKSEHSPGAGGGGNRRKLVKGYKFSVM